MASGKGARILFLTLYPEAAASPRYRVAQFLPYLEAQGFQCTLAAPVSAHEYAALTGPHRTRRPFFYHLAETRRRIVQILGAHRYDVVFVQKALMTAYLRGLPALLRARARRLVYDIDDAVHLAPPHPLRGVWRMLEDRGQIHRLFALADLVLAGNPWLKDIAEAQGARAELFPTVVDTGRFVPAGPPPANFRVGWIGNPSTTPHLAEAAPALEALQDAEIRLVGADPARVPFAKNRDFPNHAARRDGTVPGFFHAAPKIIPWSLETEVFEIQQFSAGIMPIPATEWNRGKCALKALQYMACGVPCVASPFGAVCGIIKHNENGLLAETHDAWGWAFEYLRDPEVCRQLGERGRATIETRFALNQAAPRMVEMLESVL